MVPRKHYETFSHLCDISFWFNEWCNFVMQAKSVYKIEIYSPMITAELQMGSYVRKTLSSNMDLNMEFTYRL